MAGDAVGHAVSLCQPGAVCYEVAYCGYVIANSLIIGECNNSCQISNEAFGSSCEGAGPPSLDYSSSCQGFVPPSLDYSANGLTNIDNQQHTINDTSPSDDASPSDEVRNDTAGNTNIWELMDQAAKLATAAADRQSKATVQQQFNPDQEPASLFNGCQPDLSSPTTINMNDDDGYAHNECPSGSCRLTHTELGKPKTQEKSHEGEELLRPMQENGHKGEELLRPRLQRPVWSFARGHSSHGVQWMIMDD